MWYRQLREQKERKNKLESEWEQGIWLGHTRCSNEVLVGTDSGVVRAYAIKRREAGDRWSADKLQSMAGSPQQPDPKKPGLHIPIRIRIDPPEEPGEPDDVEDVALQSRRRRMTKKTMARFGYTEGCQGCEHQRAGLKECKNHSEICRRRVEQQWNEEAGVQSGAAEAPVPEGAEIELEVEPPIPEVPAEGEESNCRDPVEEQDLER